MRFVKKQQLNPKLIEDNSVSVSANGHVVLGTNYALKVPMGTTAERPGAPENGQIRYNTDLNEFEFYLNNRRLRFEFFTLLSFLLKSNSFL